MGYDKVKLITIFLENELVKDEELLGPIFQYLVQHLKKRVKTICNGLGIINNVPVDMKLRNGEISRLFYVN